jgi:hypothetical protein
VEQVRKGTFGARLWLRFGNAKEAFGGEDFICLMIANSGTTCDQINGQRNKFMSYIKREDMGEQSTKRDAEDLILSQSR